MKRPHLNIRRFIDEPGTMVLRWEDEANGKSTLHLVEGPPVIWIADSTRRREAWFHWGDFGYLPVYRDEFHPRYRAVWPLPLWILHVIGHGAYLGFWGTIRFLMGRGLIHFDQPEYLSIQLRRLRLGRGR